MPTVAQDARPTSSEGSSALIIVTLAGVALTWASAYLAIRYGLSLGLAYGLAVNVSTLLVCVGRRLARTGGGARAGDLILYMFALAGGTPAAFAGLKTLARGCQLM